MNRFVQFFNMLDSKHIQDALQALFFEFLILGGHLGHLKIAKLKKNIIFFLDFFFSNLKFLLNSTYNLGHSGGNLIFEDFFDPERKL